MVTVPDLDAAFRTYAGDPIEDLSVRDGFGRMIEFYRTHRIDGAEDESRDGDMLLLQWGTYDWGQGPSFQLNLTRQLVFPIGEMDQELWQLLLTFHYEPGSETEALGRGNDWCHRIADAAGFLERPGNRQLLETVSGFPVSQVELLAEQQ